MDWEQGDGGAGGHQQPPPQQQSVQPTLAQPPLLQPPADPLLAAATRAQLEQQLKKAEAEIDEKRQLLSGYHKKILEATADSENWKMLLTMVDRLDAQRADLDAECARLRGEINRYDEYFAQIKLKLNAIVDKSKLSPDQRTEVKNLFGSHAALIKSRLQQCGEELFLKHIDDLTFGLFDQTDKDQKAIFEQLCLIAYPHLRLTEAKDFPKECLFSANAPKVNETQLAPNNIFIKKEGPIEAEHARQFVSRVQAKHTLKTLIPDFGATLSVIKDDFSNCGLEFDQLFELQLGEFSGIQDGLNLIHKCYTANHIVAGHYLRRNLKMSELQIICLFVAPIVDSIALFISRHAPNRDAPCFPLFFKHVNTFEVRSYYPKMDLMLPLPLESDSSNLDLPIFMIAMESKKNIQSEKASALGNDPTKMSFIGRVNHELARTVTGRDDLVSSVLYHCGDLIQFYIFYKHQERYILHFVESFDLQEPRGRYLLMHRLIGIGEATETLSVDVEKAEELNKKLKTTYPFPGLSTHPFGKGNSQSSASSSSSTSAFQNRSVPGAYVSAVAEEQHSRKDNRPFITNKERQMLNMSGYTFALKGPSWPAVMPHVDCGRRLCNQQPVICKKVASDSAELKYLQVLNSAPMRQDERNCAAQLLELFETKHGLLLIETRYQLFHCPFMLTSLYCRSQTIERLATTLRNFVSFLHEHNLAHLDIKPPNLGIDYAGRLRVLDFGLMRDATAETMLDGRDGFVGTKDYLPAEYVAGKRTFRAFELDDYATEKTIEWMWQNVLAVDEDADASQKNII